MGKTGKTFVSDRLSGLSPDQANHSKGLCFHEPVVSRLFLRVLCLQTTLSELKMIGVFTRKIIFHFGNLRSASARIKQFE